MWTAPPGEWLWTNGVYVPYAIPHVPQAVGLWIVPICGLFILGCWLWQDGSRRGTKGGTNEMALGEVQSDAVVEASETGPKPQ